MKKRVKQHCYGEFSRYLSDQIDELGVDEVWYNYYYSDYEGKGYMILRKGDLYGFHDMGHCSCYGPLESVEDVLFEDMQSFINRNIKNSELWRNIQNLLIRGNIGDYSKDFQ